MSYQPPIKTRQYTFPIRRADNGELVSHNCARCNEAHDASDPGTWFERIDQRDVWVWLCETCADKRSQKDA